MMEQALENLAELTPAALLGWLRLIRSEHVRPIIFQQLLARYGTPGAALAALPELARRGGGRRAIRLCPEPAAVAELEAAAAIGARALASCEAAYPQRLAALPDPPPLIYVLGDIEQLGQPVAAMVGPAMRPPR